MTDENYTESMLHPDSKRPDDSRRIAESRYKHFAEKAQRPLRVLEVGCGAGIFGETYQRLARSYVGIDIDVRVVSAASGRGVNARRIDRLDFETKEYFDLVTCSQVIEHILEPSQALQKIFALLNPGGFVHIDVLNHDSIAGTPTRWLPHLSSPRYGGITRPHHCVSYGNTAMKQLLASFVDVNVFSAASTHELWGQGIAPTGISGLFRALISICREPLGGYRAETR